VALLPISESVQLWVSQYALSAVAVRK
jgi:hypothetical protein